MLLQLWLEYSFLVRPTMAMVGDPAGLSFKLAVCTIAYFKYWYKYYANVYPVLLKRRQEMRSHMAKRCPKRRIDIYGNFR